MPESPFGEEHLMDIDAAGFRVTQSGLPVELTATGSVSSSNSLAISSAS